ncbi:lipase family protein [Subtercola frigoramans]|uniref:Lipase n=1 Tax=Subtercola frigoramans TaxID=120298 RepID=A0ABS2L2Z3_9MICO|nr:lipase family protein [Subtercola frigoramans]MBM7471477.1 hypothetical protein [Subtercola frigoramans]
MNRSGAQPKGRRIILAATIGVAAIIGFTSCVSSDMPTPTATANPVSVDTAPCTGADGVGGVVPTGLGPGDIVSAVDLTPTDSQSPGFPTASSVWRMLYVTTGVDENDLQLVCGMVAAPIAGPALIGGTGRMLDWSHGTVGLAQDCLPSSDPANLFWGKMPGGINAIAWGSDAGKHEGDPAGGLLQYALNKGMVVTATDYQPGETYVVGKMEASAVLDAARAGAQLMDQTFASAAPTAYDSVIWGHSQGGHAALWAGQLAESYLASTHPSRVTPTLTLVGVAAMAPASNFITLAGQPSVQPGDGLADWEMHKNVGLDLPVKSLQMQIGPALFSYIFGSWNSLASGRAPSSTAQFPAFPVSGPALELSAIVTPNPGAQTVAAVQALCLTGAQAKQVQAEVEKYSDAQTNPMLIPSVWNLPSSYSTGEYFKGGLDTSCRATTDAILSSWCAWMRWNLPGPLGTNPFAKAPIVNGAPVPLFIAQGTADDVIHCTAPRGQLNVSVPAAADCMSRALYDSLASDVYCPAGGTVGHLELQAVRPVTLVSPASHLAIPGEISAKAISDAAADLVFDGSPLQKFMTAAFEKTVAPGCSTQVANPLP